MRMTIQQLKVWQLLTLGVLGSLLLAVLVTASSASAITPITPPDPKPGSFGIEATKSKAPPTVGATIAVPGSGASFGTSPITVSGTCPADHLVQVFNNNVMVGSVVCENGSFSLQVGLFAGTNELKAIVYDALEQAGPESNIATVNYTDTRFTAFGQLITLTSNYGRRSASTGSQLTWPMQLSGGTGPYAFSVDWGDGSSAELKSQSLAGLVSLAHVYKKAGIYSVNVRATDANGVTAFLQVIAVSSGKVAEAPEEKTVEANKVVILWVPAAIALILLFPAFWLGRRSHLVSLRKKMQKERDNYAEKQ